MSFLFPSILWGLLAVAIPIIIHLFNFRRVKKLNFPNISLLKSVNTQAKTFLKLKQWLALAARVLFIASLVCAFAQPFIASKSGFNKDGRSLLSFYLDNSASMQNEIDNKSVFEIALKKLDKLANILPKSVKSQLITNDFLSAEYKNFNPSQLKNEASKLEISGSSKTLFEVIKRQANLAEKQNSNENSFFLFSDFQKSSTGDLTSLANEKNKKIYLVPNTPTETHNIYVDSVWLDNPFIRKMQNNGLNVKIVNSGNESVANLPIKLFLGDMQMNAIPTKIEGKSTTTIHFDFTANQTGFQKGKITFEDTPVTFDNSYYFVLNTSPRINIVHLKGAAQTNSYLKNAFSNDSLFNYSAFPFQNVDFGIVKNADLLIIDEAENLSNNAITAANNLLEEGGSVMVIPSKTAELSSYQAFFSQNGVSNFVKNENPEATTLAEMDRKSKFFKDIFEESKLNDHLLMPTASIVLRFNKTDEEILKTKGGQVFLGISKAKKGSIIVLASPINDENGNFPQNALFIPIMYKVAAMSIKASPIAYRFDDKTITFHSKNYSEKSLIKLRKEGSEIIPIQRVINNQLIMEMPKQGELGPNKQSNSGFYEMINGNNYEKLLAFNYGRLESQSEYYSVNELKSIFAKNKNIQILDQTDSFDFANNFKAEIEGKYFWKYFILAALIFLALEIVIIRFWK